MQTNRHWIDQSKAFCDAANLRRLVVLSISTVCWTVFSVGCDRSQQILEEQQAGEVPKGELTQAQATPKKILASCISRYQTIESYQDTAFVKLAYKSNGQLTEDRAPISVAWDRQGKIGLKVYSVVAGPNGSGRWHLALGNTYPELADQLLSRALPEKADLAWLLAEPLVSESLSAGLAGFPPQLDLLLSPQPLARLTDDAAKWSMLESQSIEGHPCSIVSLERSGLTYNFWIDQQSKLLRRLDLPTQQLPQEILTDSHVSDLRLTIEFSDLRVDQTVDWNSYRPNIGAAKQLVHRFVSPATKLETGLLGEPIPAFRLLSPNGNVAFDSTFSPDRKASVLMWLADHPACLAAAEQLAVIEQQLTHAGVEKGVVEFVPIWAESQPPAGLTFEQLQKQWKLPGRLALDRSAAGRDLFHVQEAPTVAILDSRGKLQFIDVRLNPTLDRALAPLVQRVVEGADLANELIELQRFTAVRSRAELAQAAAVDDGHSEHATYESYPPESLQLVQKGSQDFSSRIVAMAQDATLAIWVLQSDGTLQSVDASLKPLKSFATEWVEASLGTAKFVPSPDGMMFAINTSEGIEVFDSKSQQSTRFSIPAKDQVIDLQWLTMASSKNLRLAAITFGKQVMLLDPNNRQQLSGASPSMPMAIVTQSNQGDLDGLVALSDRSLESLKLNSDAASITASPVKHKLPEPSVELLFAPSFGPWHTSRALKSECTLATGWLATEELALFFLDDKMKPYWHYRLPYDKNKLGKHRIASAVSPGNGSIVWAVLDATNTIHLLRGDVMWSDHFRPNSRASGIALVPVGDRLALLVASQATVTAYELQ